MAARPPIPALVVSCLIGALSLLSMAGRASAQSSCGSNWGSPIAFSMVRPHGSAVGDWNRDGIPDFAATYGAYVVVVLGTGTTPLSAASFHPLISVPVNGTPFAVVAADLNNDAITDLVTANLDGSIAVLLGTGSSDVGTFAAPLYFPAGSKAFDVVAADFNGDGRTDVAVSDNDCTMGGANVLLSLPPLVPGQPRFAAPVRYVLGCNGAELCTADFNGDHRLDLAVAVYSAGKLQVLFGIGDGSFSAPVTIAALSGVFETRAADVDQDGIVDLVSASLSGVRVHWGLGSGGVGNGTFAAGVLISTANAASVAVGDQDGDGDLDLAFGDGGALKLYLQTSPRAFTVTSDTVLMPALYGAGFADFDRDGRADLLGCEYNADLTAVIPSQCILPPPAPVPPTPDPGGPGWQAQGKAVAPSAAAQSNATIVKDGVGGVFVVWAEASRVRGQHISSQGERLWGAAGIGICDLAQTQALPVAISDGAGGMYVAWLHDPLGSRRVRLIRMASSGVPASGWQACGFELGSTAQLDANTPPRIAPDGSGGVYIANLQTGGTGIVRLFRYSASGSVASGWPATGLSVDSAPSGGGTFGSMTSNDIVTNGAGGVISTGSYSYNQSDPCCSSGSRTDVSNVTTGGSVQLKSVVGTGSFLLNALANGSALASWSSNGNLLAVGLSSTALTQWTATVGPASSATLPRAVPDGAGGSFVVWDAAGAQAADLFSTRLTSTGATASGWASGPTTLLSQPADQREVQPAYDGNGGLLATWRDERSGDADVYFNRFDGAGHVLSGWPAGGLAIVSMPGAQRRPLLAPTDPVTAVVVWEDLRSGTAQLYAQRVTLDQPVAALATVELLSSTPTRATLRWQLTGLTEAVRVERSERDGEWTTPDAATFVGDGLHEWTDEGVVSGRRFGYRLAGATTGAVIPGSEAWVETPTELALALKGFDPNPSTRGAMIGFTLPVAAPASLRVFDVSGRAVVSRDVGALGAGRHRIDLGALPIGFYVIRLEQAGSVRVQRGTVLR